jgi:hypothetical protein
MQRNARVLMTMTGGILTASAPWGKALFRPHRRPLPGQG